MGLSGYKIRQLWLPFLILALVILAVSWILSGIVYPNNVQGDDEQLAILDRSTSTSPPTATSTIIIQLTSTSITGATSPTSTTSILNCTYTMGYWRTYPDAWLIENIVIGEYAFTKEEAIAILEEEAQDPTNRLLQQFIAALLNKLKGADATAIEVTLVQASDWLTANPPETNLTQEESTAAEELASELNDFNNGFIGPGHCSDEPATATPLPSTTPTASDTPTPTLVRTIRLGTPTPTEKKGGGPKPTKVSTTAPTNTPQPKPTDTSPPPRPTPTPAPTPTPEP